MSASPLSRLIGRCVATATHPAHAQLRPHTTLGRALAQLHALERAFHRWLIAYSISILRISIGAVFLLFGVLKFFPGVSPAQDLVEKTTGILTLGLIPGPVALVLVATLETTIGLCLISARAMRPAVYLLAIQLIGVLSPLVLLPARLFHGPHDAPTLEGQYVLKDIILVAAAMVLTATVGGARLTSKHDKNATPKTQHSSPTPKPHDA
jgi:uncharacterized membrane protein YphA (DoxX/SURF4 family)